ncbi:hypothetical protein PVAP13_4KG131715 [Panicum virgatum]|uniref:Uncharacterized protein n=1 Tax=Panicum virgatum TaxID=38727 RepID=A0A8T0TQI9_PANVG|nr:hypothetical protein PVAP13_4KG131715 [Panicum virgatum]
MGAYKVILALALTALLAGHVFTGAVVRGDEPQSTPILESGRKGNPPDHASSEARAGGIIDEKAFNAPQGYFHPPRLAPCRGKIC